MKIKRHGSDVFLQQFFDKESSTFTYLVYDQQTGEAVLIDPVYEQIERDIGWIQDLGVKLKVILETHIHADHLTGSWDIKRETGAEICVSEFSGAQNADRFLKDNEVLNFENFSLKAITTPGHTNGCMSYYVNGMLFTGDTLFIRGCGRTDFQEGSSETLFKSVREKLFSYPDDTLVYPAHNYKGVHVSTVLEEKLYNPRLKLENTLEDFIKIMDGLQLAYPKKMDDSLPHNLVCGKH